MFAFLIKAEQLRELSFFKRKSTLYCKIFYLIFSDYNLCKNIAYKRVKYAFANVINKVKLYLGNSNRMCECFVAVFRGLYPNLETGARRELL